jgi:hypothetical protein
MNADLTLFLARDHIATLHAEAEAAQLSRATRTTHADPGPSAPSWVVDRIRSLAHRGAATRPITRPAA